MKVWTINSEEKVVWQMLHYWTHELGNHIPLRCWPNSQELKKWLHKSVQLKSTPDNDKLIIRCQMDVKNNISDPLFLPGESLILTFNHIDLLTAPTEDFTSMSISYRTRLIKSNYYQNYLDRIKGVHHTMFHNPCKCPCSHVCWNIGGRKCFIVLKVHNSLFNLIKTSLETSWLNTFI